MLKFLKSKTLFIVIALLFVLFNVLFFSIADLKAAKLSMWLGYGFITFSFVVMACIALLFKMKTLNSLTAVMPMYTFTLIYFLVTVVANAVMMGINFDSYIAPVVTNVVLIILYAIAFLIAYKSFSRVDDNQQMMKERAQKKMFSFMQVQSLSGLTDDVDIVKAIKRLKETTDMSSPASTPATEPFEAEFNNKISLIQMHLSGEYDKQEILKELDEANRILKQRNQTLMMSQSYGR